jgi:hypothetical protein
VLIHHVDELEPPPISSVVELETHAPDLIGLFSLVALHRAICRPGPLSLFVCRPLQPFFPPASVNTLVVLRLALTTQQVVGHALAPANVLSCNLPEPLAQLGFLYVNGLAAVVLGAGLLVHHAEGEPLLYPEQVAQGINSSTPPFRA